MDLGFENLGFGQKLSIFDCRNLKKFTKLILFFINFWLFAFSIFCWKYPKSQFISDYIKLF